MNDNDSKLLSEYIDRLDNELSTADIIRRVESRELASLVKETRAIKSNGFHDMVDEVFVNELRGQVLERFNHVNGKSEHGGKRVAVLKAAVVPTVVFFMFLSWNFFVTQHSDHAVTTAVRDTQTGVANVAPAVAVETAPEQVIVPASAQRVQQISQDDPAQSSVTNSDVSGADAQIPSSVVGVK